MNIIGIVYRVGHIARCIIRGSVVKYYIGNGRKIVLGEGVSILHEKWGRIGSVRLLFAFRRGQMTSRWYVIRVFFGQEMACLERWRAAGLEAFLPLVRAVVGPQRRVLVRALFPGYVFARLDPSDGSAWGVIRPTYLEGTRLVGKVLAGACGRPWGDEARSEVLAEPVPDSAILGLRTRLTNEGIFEELPPVEGMSYPSFVPGDVVRLLDGPFAGKRATVQCQKGPVVYATFSNGIPVRVLSTGCEGAK